MAGSRGGTARKHGMEKDLTGIDFNLSGENCLMYPDVCEKTDLVYEIGDGILKEYIVLNGREAPNEFSFMFDSDYNFRKNDAGEIEIENPNGEVVFKLGNLFAVDSAGAYTEDLEYLIEDGVITIAVSPEFLESAERVFPVVVDPNVIITGESNTYDAYVSSKNSTSNYYNSTYLRTGRTTTFNIRRSFIKFDIPSNVLKGWITSATMMLKKRGGVAPTSVKARRVTGSWASSSVTWANKRTNLQRQQLDTLSAFTMRIGTGPMLRISSKSGRREARLITDSGSGTIQSRTIATGRTSTPQMPIPPTSQSSI